MLSAFFVTTFLFLAPAKINATSKTPCSLGAKEQANETVVISRVYDGDTVKLRDGRKIRLIGINSPELGSAKRIPEPYARKATNFLRAQLKISKQVQIRYGNSKKDRYGRLLAHIFLSNNKNLGSLMIQNGFARSLHVPPNDWQFRCYDLLDKQAQQLKIGLWSNKFFQSVNVSLLKPSKAYDSSFKQIHGIVSSVSKSKKNIWINIGPRFALRINKSRLLDFKKINFENLPGKKITARGYIVYYPKKQQFRMLVRHPIALTLPR